MTSRDYQAKGSCLRGQDISRGCQNAGAFHGHNPASKVCPTGSLGYSWSYRPCLCRNPTFSFKSAGARASTSALWTTSTWPWRPAYSTWPAHILDDPYKYVARPEALRYSTTGIGHIARSNAVTLSPAAPCRYLQWRAKLMWPPI